jgi:serine/threonine protein phosphatase PrpC
MGACAFKAKGHSHSTHLDLLDFDCSKGGQTPTLPNDTQGILFQDYTIKGQFTPSPQQPWDSKLVSGSELAEEMLHKVGFTSHLGRKTEQHNQDDFCITRKKEKLLLSVFDGHGPDGHYIAAFVRDRLPGLILEDCDPMLWEYHIKEAFEKIQTQVVETTDEFNCKISGTTASIAVVHGKTLFVASVGDSKVVLGKRVQGRYEAEVLTEDHKPTCLKERKRIEACGGEIKRLSGDIPLRIFRPGKRTPGLSLSRAIGDSMAHSIGVTHIPEITSLTLSHDHAFLLVCSDGVWEFISPQEAVNLVSEFTPQQAQQAAEKLATLAWRKWLVEERQRVDDITVVLAYLR